MDTPATNPPHESEPPQPNPSTSFGHKPLNTIAPRRRLLPNLDRSLNAVAPTLLRAIKELVVGKRRWPLLIFGDCGVGKTAAALALADHVETAIYATAEELATMTMTRDACEAERYWSKLAEKELAILDELGQRDRVTDLGYGVVKRFCDIREQECGRVAIFISNVEPSKLIDLYDKRIYSRVTGGSVIELTGADRRKVGA